MRNKSKPKLKKPVPRLWSETTKLSPAGYLRERLPVFGVLLFGCIVYAAMKPMTWWGCLLLWLVGCLFDIVLEFTFLRPLNFHFMRDRVGKTLPTLTRNEFYDLCVVAQFGDVEDAKSARNLILEILPTLTQDEWETLNAPFDKGRRNWLGKQLTGKDREFALALLSVFAEYGERSELNWVSSLADGKYLASNDLELREKSIETADTITQRISGGELKKVLLRGSTIPPVPETLLRPVAENVTEETQLLRSSQSGEEE